MYTSTMRSFLHKNFTVLELQRFLNSYFSTAVILWMIVYVFLAFLIRMFHKNYIQNRKDILEELCKAIKEMRTADCVVLLEKYSEFINKYTDNGYTPFLIACSTGNTQLVKIMLKKGKHFFMKYLYVT